VEAVPEEHGVAGILDMSSSWWKDEEVKVERVLNAEELELK